MKISDNKKISYTIRFFVALICGLVSMGVVSFLVEDGVFLNTTGYLTNHTELKGFALYNQELLLRIFACGLAVFVVSFYNVVASAIIITLLSLQYIGIASFASYLDFSWMGNLFDKFPVNIILRPVGIQYLPPIFIMVMTYVLSFSFYRLITREEKDVVEVKEVEPSYLSKAILPTQRRKKKTLQQMVIRDLEKIEKGLTLITVDFDVKDIATIDILAYDSQQRIVAFVLDFQGSYKVMSRSIDVFMWLDDNKEHICDIFGENAIELKPKVRVIVLSSQIDAHVRRYAKKLRSIPIKLLEYQIVKIEDKPLLVFENISLRRKTKAKTKKEEVKHTPIELDDEIILKFLKQQEEKRQQLNKDMGLSKDEIEKLIGL